MPEESLKPVQAVVVVLFNKRGDRVLMVQSTGRKSQHAGQWGFPGGKVETETRKLDGYFRQCGLLFLRPEELTYEERDAAGKEEFEKRTAVEELRQETNVKTTLEKLVRFGPEYTALIPQSDGSQKLYKVKSFLCTDFQDRLNLGRSSGSFPELVKVSEVKKLNLLPNVEKILKSALIARLRCVPRIKYLLHRRRCGKKQKPPKRKFCRRPQAI